MKGTKPSAHQPTSPAAAGSPSDDSGGGPSKDQDRFLPIANVSRIMKKSLPPNAKISKEAKETVQGCVSEFINFITGEASDKCQREKRKTVNGDDLLWAMKSLGFDSYVAPLKSYLGSYRESGDQEKNGMIRGRLQTGEDGRGGGGEDGGDGVDGGGGGLFRWSAGPVTSGFGGGEGFYGSDDGGGRGSSHGVHW